MSALDDLIAGKTGAPTAQASNTSNLDALISGKSVAAPAAKLSAPAAKAASSTKSFFTGKGYGPAAATDTYSGLPLATVPMTIPKTFMSPQTTAEVVDKTRVAAQIDPTLSQKTSTSTFENPRMPESASNAVRAKDHATKDQQLDHTTARALGGSNMDENLVPVPTQQNQDAGKLEGKLVGDIEEGRTSLFDAQKADLAQKGKTIKEDSAKNGPVNDYLLNHPNTLLPLAKAQDAITGAAGKVGGFLKNLFTHPIQTVKDATSKENTDKVFNELGGNAIVHPVQTVKNIVKQASDSADATLSNLAHSAADVVSDFQTKRSAADKTKSVLNLLTSAAATVFYPVSETFEIASQLPVIKPAADAVGLIFNKSGQVGGFTASALLDALPISQEWKDKLQAPVEAVGTLTGQIALGGKIYADIAGGMDPAEAKVKAESQAKDLNNAAAWRQLGSPKDMAEAEKNYRAMAHEMHPDKPGGSNEAMSSLNVAYQTLKENGIPGKDIQKMAPEKTEPMRAQKPVGELGDGTKAPEAVPDDLKGNGTAPVEAQTPGVEPASKTPELDKLVQPENEKGLTPESEKYMKAFNQSGNQEVIGKVGDKEFALGDIGKNHITAKSAEGKSDRLAIPDLKDTIANIKSVYRGSPDQTNHRSNTAAWVAEMPGGEKRVVYTKENRFGHEEITGAHKVTNANYITDLQKNGIPPGNRTQIHPLEGERPNPLNERDKNSLAQTKEQVKPAAGDKYYIFNANKYKYELVKGAKAIDIAHGVDTFIHPGKEGGFVISEGKTGHFIAQGKTERAAAMQAKKMFANAEKQGVKPIDVVDRAVVRTKAGPGKLSPRYEASENITSEKDEKVKVPEPTPKPRQTVELASGLNPNLDKFLEQDVKPKVDDLLTGTSKTWDMIKKTFAPATRGPAAEQTAAIMRESLAQMARKREKLYSQLKEARKTFDKYTNEQALDVIDKIENGQPVPGSEKFVAIIRDALDSRWQKIRQIKGTDAYIENYFPHIWKDPDEAKNKLLQMLTKRPLEGTKSYMKERKIPTIKEGVALGLVPESYNPVDLVMARVVDMDKYIMAQDVWDQFKKTGLNKFVRPGKEVPKGWRKVDDRISTSFYRPTIKEFYDEHVMGVLNDVADSLGIKHERAMGGKGLGGSRLGVSFTGQDLVKTKFATPEDVLIHEIGHQIDHKFGMQDIMNPKGNGKTLPFSEWEKTGDEFKDEMRALADLRWEGKDAGNYFKQYVRKGSEKMAVMFQSYLHAPDRFKEVAPTVYDAFVKFLGSDPKLKPLRDIKKSLVYGENEVQLHVLAKAGDWYMPEQATTIVNNYLSPGMRSNPIYNAFRMMGNTLNQVQLGLSGFHAVFTSGDAVISKAALEFQKIFDKDIAAKERALSLTKVLTAPITAPYYLYKNIVRGNALLQDYYKSNPELPKMVDALERAGGRVRMDSFYMNDSVENFLKALRSGNYVGATGRAPGAIIEAMAKPLMQELVPRQKLGVFADGAKHIMDQAEKEDWSEYKTTLRLQELWDSVDNRMGELVYDNLFWQKSLKDLGMAATRSLGWNLGTFRELGGGATDYGKLMFKAFTKEGRSNARVTPKMAYTTVLPYIVGLWGAMLFYAYNHKAPETLLDYFYPRTGRLKPDGTPERISLPSYMKDVFAYKTEPVTTITNKLHPEIATILDMLENKDYYGTEIRNPNDSTVQQIGELFSYQAQQFLPFSITNLQQRATTGSSWVDYLESFGGITPAPGYITRTPLQTQIYNLYDERFGGGTQTQDQSDAAQLKSKIRTQYLLGNDGAANKLLKQAVDQGVIKQSGVSQFVKEADIPNDVKLFTRLPVTDQTALLKSMDLYQLERYSWYASKDVKATLGDLSDNAKNFVDLVKAGEVQEPKWKRGQIAP